MDIHLHLLREVLHVLRHVLQLGLLALPETLLGRLVGFNLLRGAPLPTGELLGRRASRVCMGQ